MSRIFTYPYISKETQSTFSMLLKCSTHCSTIHIFGVHHVASSLLVCHIPSVCHPISDPPFSPCFKAQGGVPPQLLAYDGSNHRSEFSSNRNKIQRRAPAMVGRMLTALDASGTPCNTRCSSPSETSKNPDPQNPGPCVAIHAKFCSTFG